MKDKEKQFQKINNIYNTFTCLYYESQRRGSKYTKNDVNKQGDKLIRAVEVFKEM